MAKDETDSDCLGIIAGAGALPMIVARQAEAQGKRVAVAGITDRTPRALRTTACAFKTFHPGQLMQVISFLKGAGAREVALCGHIDHTRVFVLTDVDEAMRGILAGPDKRAEVILKKIAAEIESTGLPVADLRHYLKGHLAQEGPLNKVEPSPQALQDLDFAWPLAVAAAELNIGQCLMARSGVVVAVEAAEGTDGMIQRGGRLSGGRGVVVKLPLRDKDRRFDIPTVGSRTIATMKKVGAELLAVAAGNTIIIDPVECLRAADDAGIAIISRASP